MAELRFTSDPVGVDVWPDRLASMQDIIAIMEGN